MIAMGRTNGGYNNRRLAVELARVHGSGNAKCGPPTGFVIRPPVVASLRRVPSAVTNAPWKSVIAVQTQNSIRGPNAPQFDVVALACSAGGLKALSTLLAALPADFPVAIAVVQHLSPGYRSMMAHILGARTALTVKQAVDGERRLPRTVYIAP